MYYPKSVFSRSVRVVQISLLAAASLALIACSSDSDDSDSTENPEPPEVSEQDPDPAPPVAPVPGESRSTAIGEVLVYGSANRTLYTFANDETGTSNCNDGCAVTWPPILADSEEEQGSFSTIEREDNTLQWAFKGMPLYYYQGDAAEGEINGEGLGGVWYVARPDPIATGTTSLGSVLTARGLVNTGQNDASLRIDMDGRTLYVFANDDAGVSNCNDGCATNWPPLYADAGAQGEGNFSIIERSDGTSQWAYQSQALYLFSGDSAPGDTTGDGIGGVWSVAQP
ncbi:MAG: hypothetical protein KTR32_31965 [Granulosicoccus sp.]|nr:hypothetical protein [Granulosicoccus sp.]